MRKDEKEARRLVYARSGGRCERCGRRATEWHHRKNRSQGGLWAASNGIHACSECHRWFTGNPDEACDWGWSVRRFGDPTTQPVVLNGVPTILGDNGAYYTLGPETSGPVTLSVQTAGMARWMAIKVREGEMDPDFWEDPEWLGHRISVLIDVLGEVAPLVGCVSSLEEAA